MSTRQSLVQNSPSWRAACSILGNSLLKYDIEYILSHYQKKIPASVLYVILCERSGFAVFTDLTGLEISGTISKDVLNDDNLDTIATGTVIVLKDVSVFSPLAHVHYLNIVSENVVCVFSSCSSRQRLKPESFEIPPPLTYTQIAANRPSHQTQSTTPIIIDGELEELDIDEVAFDFTQ